MRGIPDRSMRMAITRISNQAGLGLFETFFGKDPAMGVTFESTDKQMFIHFVPRKGGFAVEARVFNDSMKSIERSENGDDELVLGWVNFFQIEYSGVIQKEKDPARPSDARWAICGINVESLAANLLASE